MNILKQLWHLAVHMNGGVQVVLTMVLIALAFGCEILIKRIELAGKDAYNGKTKPAGSVSIWALWFVAGVLALIAIFIVAAVFAPLLGLA
ncbi:hypothetical protein CRD60_04545 [Bifidobacterium aemilianum]|uniref:Uncharacterized protein n=1 Tax=Bifidobacterium aemilianum TaxID=2493120 RepID=A0A366K7Y4_9BIFI|nr:hypothetical protein [Bifidobacterium aemilianum]RBP97860.1 hypothetical protein CRD60_04545 [Bifidobacterium aemilianum]